MCGREFASRGFLANSKLFNARAWIVSGLQFARTHSKTPQWVFDLSALTAGECHPLGQSNATEKGTYIGNRPRCLPERFENSCEVARLCKSHAIQRSQMLWNGSCVAVQPKTLSRAILNSISDAPNEVRRVSIVRAIHIHLAVMREQIRALRTETDGRRIPYTGDRGQDKG